ncbi:MAG: tetraacyldisaccharide 4'-kinase [Steroidobacteraceae bacterium]
MSIEQRLTELWYRPRRGPSLLEPLAWAYGAAVRARGGAYRRGWLPVRETVKPVVVVGNVTIGGTGKTPLVIWLAESLRERGLEAGIVTRGYGRRTRSRAPRIVRADTPWEEVGDEPLLVHRRTGCLTAVCADRFAAAEQLVAEPIDLILSDDGLQHARLARACEIAVIDGARGLGNGRLLPAGPLREPASRLNRVAAIVMNGSAEHPSLAHPSFAYPSLEQVALAAATPVRLPEGRAAPGAPVLRMTLLAGHARRVDGTGTEQPLEAFRGGGVHAVAGIGHPERFFRELEGRGLEVSRHPFPDHHPFGARDLAFDDGRSILMTEKDAVRCAAIATPLMWYVPVSAHLDAVDAQVLLSEVCRRIDAFRPRTL